jgi:hypothetical protein
MAPVARQESLGAAEEGSRNWYYEYYFKIAVAGAVRKPDSRRRAAGGKFLHLSACPTRSPCA